MFTNKYLQVSAHIIHPDNPTLTDMHQWTVSCTEVGKQFSVRADYTLGLYNEQDDYTPDEGRYTVQLREVKYHYRFDSEMEAINQFDHQCLRAFAAIKSKDYKESEVAPI
jgi:hypothetical protein